MWANEEQRISEKLRVSLDFLSPAQRGALALIDASAVLCKHCPDLSDTPHSVRVLAKWMQLVDPKATLAAAQRYANNAHPTFHPEWLGSYTMDPDARRAFPHELVALGLIAVVPPGYARVDDAWTYARNAASYLALPGEDFEAFRGWLTATASVGVSESVEARLEALARQSATAAAVADALRELVRLARAAVEPAGPPPFLEARQRVIEQVDRVLKHVEALQVTQRPLLRLREFATDDYFRLAVLGEFKRGKSTLVNALVEAPDLMPAAVKPCTSALTALRYGVARRYFEQSTNTPSGYVERDAHAFKSQVGQASGLVSVKEEAISQAEAVPRWRVEVPSSFLAHAFVELVDSPGLGEDYARDQIAQEEARRADAVILVLSTTQIASIRELDLVTQMESKLENLIVVINHADLVDQPDREELRQHVENRLRARGLEIPRERIVFVSAREAERAARAGRASDEWVDEMRQLRDIVERHLLMRSGPHKARILAGRVREAAHKGRAEVDRTLAHRRGQYSQLTSLGEQRNEAEAAYKNARASINSASESIAAYEDAAARYFAAYIDALPSILAEVKKGSDKWTTEYHPLASSRKHITEVGEKAKASVLKAMERWFHGAGAQVLSTILQEKLTEGQEKTEGLRRYLEVVLGRSGEEIGETMDELKLHALEDAFGAATTEPNAVDAVLRVAIGSALGLLIGYIVADIILYYVLGLIAGFANPVLLAAALAGGVIAWVSGGGDLVEASIRGKVFDELQKAFLSDVSKEKIRAALSKALQDAFHRLSHSFRTNAEALLFEAKSQGERVRDELERVQREAGTPAQLASEIEKLVSRAAEASRAYDALDEIASEVLRGSPA